MSASTRLGVLGWPVAHSRSPAMHNAALRAVGLHEWRYQLLPVAPELFAETVCALPAAGFAGANVTIPHKEQALRLADRRTERAQAIGAANTLHFAPDGSIDADNTDAPALIAALPFAPAGRTAVVLGAGGSARAAVWALRAAGAARVSVWNRTPERAAAVAAEFGAQAVAEPPAAEILINCTSIGLNAREDAFKQLPVDADALSDYACVVDYVYRELDTRLIEAARRRAVATVDGLELLVGQGALSFTQFTGRPAPVQIMIDAVRVR